MLSAGQFLHNACKANKWGDICFEHDWIVNFAGFLMIEWKKHLLVQKGPQKTTFSNKFQIFDIFLVLKQWVTLLKYKDHKKKVIDQKCKK